jgi:hypothetical protein
MGRWNSTDDRQSHEEEKMSTRKTMSPVPILIIIGLAAISLIQLIAPDLVHPGLTLALIGIVFLILYFIRWVREPVTLITGWVLGGFGLSFWSLSYEPFNSWGLPIVMFGLGLSFIGIYLTIDIEESKKKIGRGWPLIPGSILIFLGIILVLEETVGRQRLWSLIVPLIPSIIAIWFIIEWRRSVTPPDQESLDLSSDT